MANLIITNYQKNFFEPMDTGEEDETSEFVVPHDGICIDKCERLFAEFMNLEKVTKRMNTISKRRCISWPSSWRN